MRTCKDSILEELTKGIVNINYNDNTTIPYTTLSKYNVIQTDDHEKINVYNLITDEIVYLCLKNIISYTTGSDKCTENYITQCKKDLESVDDIQNCTIHSFSTKKAQDERIFEEKTAWHS